MKHMIVKLADVVTRMKHMFDAYEKTLNELRGTPAYVQLFDTCEMM